MLKLGEKVKFEKCIKKENYGKDKDVSKEFCEICDLHFIEDKSFINGFSIGMTKWRGFKLEIPVEGIVCGLRNIGIKVWNDDYGCTSIEKFKQVYLLANKMSGFYYVLPEWVEQNGSEET